MKLTKQKLEQLIKEAMSKSLSEMASPTRKYTTDVHDHHLWEPFIQSAKFWSNIRIGGGATGKEPIRPRDWLINFARRKTGKLMDDRTVEKLIQIALVQQSLADTVQDLWEEYRLWEIDALRDVPFTF